MSDSRYGEVNDLMGKVRMYGALRVSVYEYDRAGDESKQATDTGDECASLLKEIEKDLDELCATRRN